MTQTFERTTAGVPTAAGGSPALGPRAARSRRADRLNRRDRRAVWLLLLPAAVILLGLFAYPLYQLGLLSVLDFRQAQVSGGEPTSFVGLAHYATLAGDRQFWVVLVQTVLFAAVCVVSTLLVGGTLAVLLTRVDRGPRTVLLLAALAAWAAPAMTGSIVWLFLFDTNLGLVNDVLVGLGLDGFAGHSWTYDRYSAFGLVAATIVWHSFPLVMITLYAGIRAVPESLVEAAQLDGASVGRIFVSVIMPILRPLLLIVTIQSIIWDFKVFTQIYVMTGGGGIAGQNLTLNVYAYQTAFSTSNYGLGSAIGVVTTVILLAITLLYLRAVRRSGEPL